jgi:hypothetical protein
MTNSSSAIPRTLKQTLIALSLAGAGFAAVGASAKPDEKPDTNSVAIYEVQWGPACSTFSVTSSVNEAGNTKDISNIVLMCGTDAEGNVTWDKWEFESPYVFGTELPDSLAPSEGNGCTGPIRTAYVKAGSFKSGKGIPGVDRKQFNGHVGGEIHCDALGGN